MRAQLILIGFCLATQAGFGAEMAGSSGDSEFLSFDAEMVPVDEPTAQPIDAQIESQPELAPEAPKVPEHPPAEVFVTVDQYRQQICIDIPSENQHYCDKVSTGGTIKVPHKAAPYCGFTHNRDRLYIPAVYEKAVRKQVVEKMTKDLINKGYRGEDLKDQLMIEDNQLAIKNRVRERATMFDVWESRRFADKNDVPAPMPLAIKIGDGEFLHVAPSQYMKYLGDNVSGGCVRLSKKTAKFLFSSMMKHGGIELSVVGQPRDNHCDPKRLAQVQEDYANGELDPSQVTGSEGVNWGWLTGMFGGGSSSGSLTTEAQVGSGSEQATTGQTKPARRKTKPSYDDTSSRH